MPEQQEQQQKKEIQKIHSLTGKFVNSTSEMRYRMSSEAGVRFNSRTALFVVSVIFAMFNITDYNLLGWSPEYHVMLAMRVTVVASCLVLAYVIGRHGNLTRRAWLHALPLWILATGVILIVPMRPESLLTQITAVVVSIMAFYLLIPNLLKVAAYASAYLSIGFVVAAVIYADTSTADTIRLSLLLIMTNLVGYTALLRLEILQRKQFALLHEERDQNLQLTSEISHRKSLERKLRKIAERDALTGVLSRSYFMTRANALLQRANFKKQPFCLFMLDVDHFKQINDTLGHVRGDQVLSKVAEVCLASLRPEDLAGRYGGEEFVIVLPDTCLKDAEIIAQRLRANIAASHFTNDLKEVSLTVTIGIVESSGTDQSLEFLITRADEMLYVGKREGRNKVVIYPQAASS